MSAIIHVASLSQLDGILAQDKEKVTVRPILWNPFLLSEPLCRCGPCHAIAPTFAALSEKYPKVNFLKVDVDAAQDVARKYQVMAMPTFIFLRGNTKIDQIRGANRSGLEDAVKKHSASSTSSAFGGSGHRLGGDTDASGQPADSGMDPQLSIFLVLLGVYVFFWYFR
ncbi:thioredoxin-domain-containing protein [Cylindrobasidium torrendii FP15055 ss-10]|uniref:Thioredoxin-domain-containing protein n=1 Tax=Cylindrobasidium torrendii FP15055 ss-10 TaxID=1314674 RepID=A0A0D7BV21_9AGAR|nr:thioredoxin-domain-containing protein [Cylindrobasidium torrendii FP15055 ss-10]